MRRRSFLAGGLAGLSATSLSVSGASATSLAEVTVPPRVLVIEGITANTSLAGLRLTTQILAQYSIPFVCVIDPSVSTAEPLMPKNKIAKFLRDFYLSHPGVVELAPYIADLEQQRPYFQARLASLAIAQLTESLGLPSAVDRHHMLSTIACRSSDNPNLLSGLRSSSIRTVLSLPKTAYQPISNRFSSNGTLHLIGGRQLDVAGGSKMARTSAVQSRSGLLVISADSLETNYSSEFVDTMLEMAERLRSQDVSSNKGVMLPRDILIRDGNNFQRRIAVHLLDATSGDKSGKAAVAEMAAELSKNSIEFSISSAAPPSVGSALSGLSFWISANDKDRGKPITAEEIPDPLWASFAEDAQTPFPSILRAAPGLEVILRTSESSWNGLDSVGRYHQRLALAVAEPEDIRKIVTAINPLADGLIVLQPTGVVHNAQRASIIRALNTLRADSVTKLVSLPNLIAEMVPEDKLLKKYRETEAASVPFTRRTSAPVGLDRETLLEDARVAWRYFETLTNARTGLCSVAYNFAPGANSRYDRASMWEIGSQINALIAAVDLEFVTEDDFTLQIAKILKQIQGKPILGLQLPPELIDINTGRSTSNFNASDTCRLLATLANLAAHPFGDKIALQKLVSNWDLEGVILEENLHSIVSRKFQTAARSQYSHYSVMGLRAWNLEAKSPYDGMTDLHSTDQKISFLELLSLLGPFGTEPMLLEVLDYGFSPSASYMTDLMFTALIDEYQESGRLLCPSETPLDQSPWFTYHGLQIDDDRKPWHITALDDGDAVDVADDLMAISTKSAFLWASVLDHPHAEKLLTTVRDKARNKVGFASSIYVKSGLATKDYTDLNTNGIILQAISHMFKYPRP
jgi:hypothetical protein